MAELSTPEQDKAIGELRDRLAAWLAQAAHDGYDHSLALTALMMFTASGAVSTKRVEREEFLEVMAMYFDLYTRSADAEAEHDGPKPS
jgi:hypothetical protein